jgi:hypothetical protein
MGYAAAKKAGFGTGIVEVSIGMIAQILRAGWSTGSMALRCVDGIPADAQLTAITTMPHDRVRIYFRSQELPAQDRPPVIVARYGSVDVGAYTTAMHLVRLQDFLAAVPVKRQRGRIATWLRIGSWERARIDALNQAYAAVITYIEGVFPKAPEIAMAIREAMAAKAKGEPGA